MARNDTGVTAIEKRGITKHVVTRPSVKLKKEYYVYIMTNHKNIVLYTGVTNDLQRRVYEHKNKLVEGFTKRYNLMRLVYFESCGDIGGAIIREKQIKAGSRQDKISLIDSVNRDWHDLSDEL